MADKKRKHANSSNNSKKKYKLSSGFLDPGTSGIYATCTRKHEKQAASELKLLFEEKFEELYDLNHDAIEQDKTEAMTVEEKLCHELAELQEKDSHSGKDKNMQFIDINCECVIFCKTRRPIEPEKFVKSIMDDLVDEKNMTKRTRYINKLTPISYSCSASIPELVKLCSKVLDPHFGDTSNTKPLKFAVELTRRNFNTLERMPMINEIVKYITTIDKGHTVDLKKYDKLILVECFKNNIGMSVVDGDYANRYRRYNIHQIYTHKKADS